MKNKQLLPTVASVLQAVPISQQLAQRKIGFDKDIQDAIANKDRLVLVVGPCSADYMDSMTEYLSNLKQIADMVSDKILIVARVYTAKPRTDGKGYLGRIFSAGANSDIDIADGIVASRKLMVKCLEIGLPVADELLYPFVLPYLGDLVSYYFLGARSSMDPLHRDYASSLSVAVGVKNGIDGDLVAVAKSVSCVQSSRVFADGDSIITTSGNSNSHVVLRGGHNGEHFVSNGNADSCQHVKQLCEDMNLANNFVMVDCSHANSGKVASRQVDNALALIEDSNVNGMIIESYINGGSGYGYGESQTDDCLSWDDTELLIAQLYLKLEQRNQ